MSKLNHSEVVVLASVREFKHTFKSFNREFWDVVAVEQFSTAPDTDGDFSTCWLVTITKQVSVFLLTLETYTQYDSLITLDDIEQEISYILPQLSRAISHQAGLELGKSI